MWSKSIPGWIRQTAEESKLTVLHQPDESYWVGVAAAVRQGNFPNLQSARSARTSRVQHGYIEPADTTCFIKEYLPRDWQDAFKDYFRASRARRALINGERCSVAGFHVARARCLIEEYRGGVLTYCALISDEIEDAPLVREWLTDPRHGLTDDRSRRRQFLDALAREIGRWHGAGFYHGDLRLGNILARRDADVYTFYWLDNERTMRYRSLPNRRRIQNLTRLDFEPCGISATERLRFWKKYLRYAKLAESDQDYVLRQTVEKTHKRRSKYGWA